MVAYCFFLVDISVSLMLQGFLKTRNSSRLNKILALKDLRSLLHAYIATQWLELWSNKKSVGFTFSCFLGMPVLASEPCLSSPLLQFCGCRGFLFLLPRSRATGVATVRAASLPGDPAGHGMAQQLWRCWWLHVYWAYLHDRHRFWIFIFIHF